MVQQQVCQVSIRRGTIGGCWLVVFGSQRDSETLNSSFVGCWLQGDAPVHWLICFILYDYCCIQFCVDEMTTVVA